MMHAGTPQQQASSQTLNEGTPTMLSAAWAVSLCVPCIATSPDHEGGSEMLTSENSGSEQHLGLETPGALPQTPETSVQFCNLMPTALAPGAQA